MKGFDIPLSRKVNSSERQKNQFQKDTHWETFGSPLVKYQNLRSLEVMFVVGRLRMLLREAQNSTDRFFCTTSDHLS